jgi:signal transduction histidine kinase
MRSESEKEEGRVATPSVEDPLTTDLLLPVRPEADADALERRLRRLAFDLHDGALQELAAVAAELRSVRRQVASLVAADVRARVEGRFDDVEARLAALEESLRRLVANVKGYHDPVEALDTKIAREVAALRDESMIEAELEITGSFHDLTDSRRIAIFQVVREALANVREHSGAAHVRVRVVEHGGRVEVSVEDDGSGFERDEALEEAAGRRRFGLTGMIERVRMLGSELELETSPGGGTRVGFVLEAWDPAELGR